MMVVNHHHQILDFDNLTKAQMDNMDCVMYSMCIIL